MVKITFDEKSRNGHIILRPNLSASWRLNIYIILIFSLVCFGIAFYFFSIGAPLVLPFAGLEVMLLSTATWFFYRDYSRQEVLNFSDNEIYLESGRSRPEVMWKCPRNWAKTKLIRPSHPWYQSRVGIQSHAQFLEIGSFLNEEERDDLAHSLKAIIG